MNVDPFRDTRPAALNRLLDVAVEGGTNDLVLPSAHVAEIVEYVQLLEIAAVTVAAALDALGVEIDTDV